VPAVKAAPAGWPGASTAAEVWAASLHLALAQVMGNAAELADGAGNAEHLHQLRVGLRRLRAALRLFAPWGGDAPAALALEADWREPFAALGTARDADVLALHFGPRLAAAGAPAFEWPVSPSTQDPAAVVRSPGFNQLLMRTLALSLAQGPAHGPALAEAAREVLRPAWRLLQRDAAAFAEAGAETRHRTRKRLKRFRYALEFLLPLYPAKPARRLLRAMTAALTTLGDLNDIELALATLRPHAPQHPQLWFAVGWLTARLEAGLVQVEPVLQALADAPRVWRRT